MPVVLLSAAVTCVAALALGQGVLRLCGRRLWSWQAAPIGLALLMLLAIPALHVPGRTTTTAVAIGVLVLAGLVAMVRDPALRPPAGGLLAAAPLALLALLPFLAAGRAGTLGVGFDNDMAAHLLQATAYASEAVAHVNQLADDYPLGLHAYVASLSTGLDGALDLTFAGMILACPILLGWTALGALRRVGWIGRTFVATLCGMPFLIAGFYGESAFKEIVLAALLLGLALALLPDGRAEGRMRWVPVGVLIGGMLSVYSYTALLWVGLVTAVWVAGLALVAAQRGPLPRAIGATARAQLLPLLIGAGALLVLLAPQLPRIVRFYGAVNGAPGQVTSPLGNLAGRLPFWEAFGIWGNPDFRIGPPDPLTTGAWAALVLGLAIYGAGWCARRGDWALPAATIGMFLAWVFADRTQSPYNASKALAMLSPFVLLLATRPLVERRGWADGMPRWWGIAAPLVLLVLAGKMVVSSAEALRIGHVGPRDHLVELRDLRAELDGRPTLFLGNDDFIRWELAGVPLDAAVIGFPALPLRPEKAWQYGQAIDVDTVQPSELNRVDWVIAPRDAAASAMPPQLRLVRTTRDFALWRRVGTVPDRSILPEHGGAAGVRLDCRTPAGSALARHPGVAGVRTPPIAVAAPTLAPGAHATVRIALPAGRWALMATYGSTFPVHVSAPGLMSTLPPNLDRPGTRWPIGTVELGRPATLALRLRVDDVWLSLSPPTDVAVLDSVVAARVGDERTIPLRQACGHYVDWYRLAPGGGPAAGASTG
jgi:hypothetical protein